MEKNPCTITIGPLRFSYLHLWEPVAIEEGQQKKFSVSAIIPKSDKATLAAINKAIELAKQNGKDSKFAGKIPANLKTPLRDGDVDRPDDEAYVGSMFMNCHATTRPGVVDRTSKPIVDQEEVYSGAYGYLNISLYPYNAGGSKGVAAGFNHLMKTKDGERLSGRTSVESAFGDLELDDDASSLM
jgi:Protein of unknown function (DUF2815)